jgi:hypothetical protein
VEPQQERLFPVEPDAPDDDGSVADLTSPEAFALRKRLQRMRRSPRPEAEIRAEKIREKARSNYQARGPREGALYEDLVLSAFQYHEDYVLVARDYTHAETQIQLDLVLRTPGGRIVYVECKGSHSAARGNNGLRRNENAKRVLHQASELSYATDRSTFYFVVATSDLPLAGAKPHFWLTRAWERGDIDGIVEVPGFVWMFHPRNGPRYGGAA